MGWRRFSLTTVTAVCAVLAFSALASAHASADTISLSSPAGPNYASYPIGFSGSVTDDGNSDDEVYDGWVVWVPASSGVFESGCPASYAAAAQAVDYAGGGPAAVDSYEAEIDISDPFDAGTYPYTATANDDSTDPTLTSPGAYVACAYLTDGGSTTTYAVSSAVAFTVVNPPGAGAPPQGFGGPPGKQPSPSNLTLKVGLTRTLRDPGHNILTVGGQFSPSDGPVYLDVDLKQTSRYNGCAANEQQDQQITLADGGVLLADAESVTPNGAGQFRSPIGLTIRRRVPGTYVVCAYLVQQFSDIAVGFDRITVSRHPSAHKKTHKRPSHRKPTHKKKKRRAARAR